MRTATGLPENVRGRDSLFSKRSLLQVSDDQIITVGEAPPQLVALGAKDVPLVISGRIINKVTDGKHGGTLDIGRLMQVSRDLYNPLAILQSATNPKNSVVILTETIDINGDPVIVPVHIGLGGDRNTVHSIKSIYGKENGERWVSQQIEAGRLLYVNTEKAQNSRMIQRLHLPTLNESRRQMRGESVLGFKESILTEKDIVKPLYSKDGTIAGAFDPQTGKAYLVADAIKPGQAQDIFLHEAGHALLATEPLFLKARGKILSDFARLARVSPAVKAAFDRVPKNTAKSFRGEEAIAYFIQEPANRKHNIFKRIIAAVKAALFRMGISVGRLKEADLVALFTRGAKSLANKESVSTLEVTNKDYVVAFAKQHGISVEEAEKQYADAVKQYGADAWQKAKNAGK